MTAKELKKERARLGMTQAQLAKFLEVALNTVSRWEQEVHAIPKSVALALKGMKAERPK